MKGHPFKYVVWVVISLFLLMIPSVAAAEIEQSSTGPPPVEQQLVREGELAVRLVSALGMGDVSDEDEAESRLAELGIAPRSGWIADYPVTPDISGELRNAVAAAADVGKLSMGRDEAMRVFDKVLSGVGLPLAPYTGETAYDSPPPTYESYSDPTVINNYYYNEGPPIVTYYAPPPAYIYLYAWVPYPFWCAGFLYPGYFVLNDFHRTVFVHNRTVFVTNHFRDARTHRVFRIDPLKRFKGDSFVVRRSHDSRAYISDKGRRLDRKFSDVHRTRSLHDGRTFSPRSPDNRVVSLPTGSYGGDTRRHVDRTRNVTHSSRDARSYSLPTGSSGRDTRQHVDRTRSFSYSSQGVRSFNRPSGGFGGDTRQHFDRARSFNHSSPGMRSFSRSPGGSGGSTQHFRSGGMSSQHSQGYRSFSRSSSWGGSTSMHSGGARTFSPAARGGGFSHGGRGRR